MKITPWLGLVVLLLATIFTAGCSETSANLPRGLSVSDTFTGIKIVATDNPEVEFRDYYAEQTTMGNIHGGEWHVRISYVTKKSGGETTRTKSHEFVFEGAAKPLDIVFYGEDGKMVKKEEHRPALVVRKATPSPSATPQSATSVEIVTPPPSLASPSATPMPSATVSPSPFSSGKPPPR